MPPFSSGRIRRVSVRLTPMCLMMDCYLRYQPEKTILWTYTKRLPRLLAPWWRVTLMFAGDLRCPIDRIRLSPLPSMTTLQTPLTTVLSLIHFARAALVNACLSIFLPAISTNGGRGTSALITIGVFRVPMKRIAASVIPLGGTLLRRGTRVCLMAHFMALLSGRACVMKPMIILTGYWFP